MDKKYWKEYYNNKNAPMQPSFFARFVLDTFMDQTDRIIELGCGNGRDSLFFARHGMHVTAVDQVDVDISSLAGKDSLSNLVYMCADFTKLEKMEPFHFVYSRFTLHSISEKEESAVLKWSHDHLKKGGKILIEARGKENELHGRGDPVPGEPDAYVYEDHFRRFIDLRNLQKKMSDVGYKVLTAEEKRGFAPLGDTDQVFIRVIGLKE